MSARKYSVCPASKRSDSSAKATGSSEDGIASPGKSFTIRSIAFRKSPTSSRNEPSLITSVVHPSRYSTSSVSPTRAASSIQLVLSAFNDGQERTSAVSAQVYFPARSASESAGTDSQAVLQKYPTASYLRLLTLYGTFCEKRASFVMRAPGAPSAAVGRWNCNRTTCASVSVFVTLKYVLVFPSA